MKGVTSTVASFSAFAVLGEAKINADAENIKNADASENNKRFFIGK